MDRRQIAAKLMREKIKEEVTGFEKEFPELFVDSISLWRKESLGRNERLVDVEVDVKLRLDRQYS